MADGGTGLGRFKSAESKQRSLDAPRRADRLRWRGKLKIPERCHPLIRFLFSIMNEQGVQIGELAEETNIARSTFWQWGHRSVPAVDILDAAFNAVGYKLIAIPIEDAHAAWIPVTLLGVERRVVEVLLRAYPNGMSVEDIAIQAQTTGNAVKVHLSKIRKAGVVVEFDKPGEVAIYRLGSRNFIDRPSPIPPPQAPSSSQTDACALSGS